MPKATIPLQAILALVRYLEADEGKDWAGMRAAGEDTSKHIFNSVTTVSDWLETQGMGTAAERAQERLQPILDAFARAGVASMERLR